MADDDTQTSSESSELLLPVVSQITLDKTRLRGLVNGDETETVDLEILSSNTTPIETRTVKSIAGQIAERINNLSYDFEQAKNTIEDTEVVLLNAKDDAVAARDAAQTSESNATTAASESETARDEARTYRNETAQYYNDVFQDPYYFPYYLTKSVDIPTSGEIDVTNAAVNRLDGTTDITLSFVDSSGTAISALPTDRAQSIIIFITGAGGNITWPTEVEWSGDNVPELGTNWTSVILFWTGNTFIGITSGKR